MLYPIYTHETYFERRLHSSVTKSVQDLTTITGTVQKTIWTPVTGKKFILKGFTLSATVRAALVATNPRLLSFFDASTADLICETGIVFQATQGIGVWYTATRDFKEGIPSGAVNRALILGFSGDIGAGVVSVSVDVWGEEA